MCSWQVIQGRSLDQLYILEENLLSGKGDLAAVEALLQVNQTWEGSRPACVTLDCRAGVSLVITG